MGKGNQLSLIIDRSERNGIFTNNQVVRGRVEITVVEALTLSTIDVSIEGSSYSKMVYYEERVRHGNQGLSRKTVRNIHTQVFDKLILFPPPDQRKNLSSQQFTLVEGQYVYPFSFILPMKNECGDNKGLSGYLCNCPEFYDTTFDYNYSRMFSKRQHDWYTDDDRNRYSSHISRQLPPTFSYGDAEVGYVVSSVVNKPGLLLFNMKETQGFPFLPADKPQPLYGGYISKREKLVVPKHRNNGGALPQLYFEVRRHASARLIPGEEQILRLCIAKTPFFRESKLPDIFLHSIKVKLRSFTNMHAINASRVNTMYMEQMSDTRTLKLAKLDMKRIELNNMKWKEDDKILRTEIPLELYSFKVPHNICPSFETCNIARSYYLEVTLTYAFDVDANGGIFKLFLLKRKREVFIMTEEVVVGSGISLPPEPVPLPSIPVGKKGRGKATQGTPMSRPEEPLPLYEE